MGTNMGMSMGMGMLDISNLHIVDLALLCHPIAALLAGVWKTDSYTRTSRRRRGLTISFVALLAFRIYTSTTTTTTTTTTTSTPALSDLPHCQTHDAPNPIAHLYPTNATGTLNGTISILPIPLRLARALIPAHYRILTHAWSALLPQLPAATYPLVLQALHDHGVQAHGHTIPDFSRAGLEFPFVDLLGDGSSFKWTPALLMSEGHVVALQGAAAYGIETLPAAFEPQCDAYVRVPGREGATAFRAWGAGGEVVETLFERDGGDDLLGFFGNVTNQPAFGDGASCSNMIRLFNTSVTTGIERVRGRVRVKVPPLGERVWEGVEGIRLDSAFIENNYVPCEELRGYGES